METSAAPYREKNEKEGPRERVPGHLQMLIKDGIAADLISKREKTNSRRINGFSQNCSCFCHTSGIKIYFFLTPNIRIFPRAMVLSTVWGSLLRPFFFFQFGNQFWNSKWCIFKIVIKFPPKCRVFSMVCQAENLIDVFKVPSIVFFDSSKTCLIALFDFKHPENAS